MSDPAKWAKVLGGVALVGAVAGVGALVLGGDRDDETEPPDDIEGDDDESDDGLPVEPETIPEVFEK